MLKILRLKILVLVFSLVILSSFTIEAHANSFSYSMASFYGSSFNKHINIRYSSLKPTIAKIETPKQTDIPKLLLSIPSIGLNDLNLVKASVVNLDDLNNKMLYNPIMDTLTSEPCLYKSSTYILGHSEPPSKALSNKPATSIFKDVNMLKVGDKIQMQNTFGAKCQYNVIGSEIVDTNSNDGVSVETFNRLYFPQVKDNSILRIQTCVKGSTTKRLIFTAILE